MAAEGAGYDAHYARYALARAAEDVQDGTQKENEMPREVMVGDIVTVNFTNRYCFSFQEGPYIEGCEVLRTPCDVGDMWTFRKDERVFSVNPCCSCFVGVSLERKAG